MKRFLLLLILIINNLASYSQDTLVLYLDNNFQQIKESEATITRTVIIKDNHYNIADQFIDGRMINFGQYSSITPSWIEDGLSVHYNSYGDIYSRGYYAQGKMLSRWIYYSNDKIDTVNYLKAHNYYSYKKDSCQLNIQEYFKDDTLIEKIRTELNDFVQAHLKLPAKERSINFNYEIYVELVIDTDGTIKCPKVENDNIDLIYETLRILFLYKCNYTLNKPVKLTIPVVFKRNRYYGTEQAVNVKSDISCIDEEGFWFVENNASFQGGDINKFNNWVKENLQYPKSALDAKLTGKVIVQFSISRTGEVCDVKIIKSAHPALDTEAIRVISSSPNWSPALNNEKPVKQNYVLPVSFTLK